MKTAATILATLVVMLTAATARADAPVPATGPQVTASVDAALRYWAELGRRPNCPAGVSVYIADLGTTASGLHSAGRAYPNECRVDVDRSWVASLTAPVMFCQLMVHEIGHLTWLRDGGTGYAVMDAPSVEALPPIPACLAAFPPPPPPPPPAPVAAPPVTVPPPAPSPAAKTPAARLTLKTLRAEAARTLRGKRMRPVACKLSGTRRGTCRVKRSGRSCRGRVYVGLTGARSVWTFTDARCVRSSRRRAAQHVRS